MKTFLFPHRCTMWFKKNPWNVALTMPNVPMIYPIVGGLKFRPPISSGMEKNSGNRAIVEIFKNARMA